MSDTQLDLLATPQEFDRAHQLDLMTSELKGALVRKKELQARLVACDGEIRYFRLQLKVAQLETTENPAEDDA